MIDEITSREIRSAVLGWGIVAIIVILAVIALTKL